MVKARGYAVLTPKTDLVPFEFDRRALRPHDVEITITHTGICHSDIHQGREEWGQAIFPMVPGHEIVGRVKDVGEKASKFAPGQLVGVGVFIDSCRECENCKAGLQQYCAQGMTGTYNTIERDGSTVAYGGYSNLIVVDENYVVSVPETLEVAGVAPLMCAGITLYSPLRHWEAGPGKKVGIIGLGGLGHMGVKFAHAMGAHLTVFSHSERKKSDALAMGADDFVANPSDDYFKKNGSSFDLILNTVSVDVDLEKYLSLLRLNGTLVLIGLPGKPYQVPAGVLLGKRRRLAGSMIGGVPELQEMLNFCGSNQIVSDIELIQPDYINKAWERTVARDVKYRFVIDASSF